MKLFMIESPDGTLVEALPSTASDDASLWRRASLVERGGAGTFTQGRTIESLRSSEDWYARCFRALTNTFDTWTGEVAREIGELLGYRVVEVEVRKVGEREPTTGAAVLSLLSALAEDGETATGVLDRIFRERDEALAELAAYKNVAGEVQLLGAFDPPVGPEHPAYLEPGGRYAPWCSRGGPSSWLCSREHRHDGDHAAHVGKLMLARWRAEP